MINKYQNNLLQIEYQNNGYALKLQVKDTWGWIDHYYIKDELVNEFPLTELMKHRSNSLDENDKVYFTKSSSIPRYKLKEFLDLTKTNLNRTNRIEQATAYIASINAFKELIYGFNEDKYNTYYVIPADDIQPHAARGYKTEVIQRKLETVLLKESDIKHFSALKSEKYPKITIIPHDTRWGGAKMNQAVESFVYLAKKPNTKIIFDETLIEMCNSGVVIDEEIYENLSSMLNSDNKENISLAMEIISNSDFIQSKIYILLLLNEYQMEFKLVDKTTNYKSLLNYFSSYNEIISRNWETFADVMIRKHCSSDEEKAAIKKYMLSRLNEHMKNYNCKLTIKDIIYE